MEGEPALRRGDRRHSQPGSASPLPIRPLTALQHPELLVVELSLLAGHQGAGEALPHGVHEAHARQRHLLATALVAEALPTAAAVVLGGRQQ